MPVYRLLPPAQGRLVASPESHISHITTPRDLSVLASDWVSRSQLETGMALDARPLALLAGPLTAYAGSLLRQLAWRSVLSAGTSPDAANSGKNVLFAVGWHLPLVDGADPRADPLYIHDLEKAYSKALNAMPQCPLGPSRAPTGDEDARQSVGPNHYISVRCGLPC